MADRVAVAAMRQDSSAWASISVVRLPCWSRSDAIVCAVAPEVVAERVWRFPPVQKMDPNRGSRSRLPQENMQL